MEAKTVLHYPRLDTVLMVEDKIRNAKKEKTKMQLWSSLPKQVQYQTFQIILDYLTKSNKITYSKDNRIIWIASNPKLEKAIKKARGIKHENFNWFHYLCKFSGSKKNCKCSA